MCIRDRNTDARDAVGDYRYGFHDPENHSIRFDSGLSEQVVRDISELKDEPEWMTEIRVKAYHHFANRPMPTWGNMSMLQEIDFDAITYFLRSSEQTEKDWDDVPEDIRNTFDRLGIPEAEQKWLSGVTAQYESEAVYHSIRDDLEEQGVIFLDMDSGLKEYPELVKKWFCTVVPYAYNTFYLGAQWSVSSDAKEWFYRKKSYIKYPSNIITDGDNAYSFPPTNTPFHYWGLINRTAPIENSRDDKTPSTTDMLPDFRQELRYPIGERHLDGANTVCLDGHADWMRQEKWHAADADHRWRELNTPFTKRIKD